MDNAHNLLENQVAIITGAGRGIGRATALAFARAGASVVLAARSTDEIASVADEIKYNRGGYALAIPTDVSDAAEVDHLLVLTLRAFGQIDILVNNAALVHPIGRVWETSPLAWQKLIKTNLLGPYFCARAVLPHMLERGNGRIINVSSGVADMNLEGTSAYNASKAALERFSGTLAAEVEGTGVVVTTLRPGIVDTQMQADIRETPANLFPQADLFQSFQDQNQLRPPTDPAQAILWLASHFANNTNGQLLRMDDETFQQHIASDLGLLSTP
jgi:NAD(P)-dependent dehydrogenase (short-subunit alcohol dehydrogenase family)